MASLMYKMKTAEAIYVNRI